MIDPILYPPIVRPRRGDWFQTWRGGKAWPLDPRPEDIHVDDIANALARVCRFGGHIRDAHYGVAQHSVLVSMEVGDSQARPDLAFAALMHDAAEAYLGDMVRPLKLGMLEYKALEQEWALVIGGVFGLGDRLMNLDPVIKRADTTVLQTERRDLLVQGPAWERHLGGDVPPRVERIRSWSVEESVREFMWWFGKPYQSVK